MEKLSLCEGIDVGLGWVVRFYELKIPQKREHFYDLPICSCAELFSLWSVIIPMERRQGKGVPGLLYTDWWYCASNHLAPLGNCRETLPWARSNIALRDLALSAATGFCIPNDRGQEEYRSPLILTLLDKETRPEKWHLTLPRVAVELIGPVNVNLDPIEQTVRTSSRESERQAGGLANAKISCGMRGRQVISPSKLIRQF